MEFDDLVKRVVSICYDVHGELGCGFVEKVYENSLLSALDEAGFIARAQQGIEAKFRGQVVGEFYVDIIVEETLFIELKAVSSIESVHKAQLLNYLKSSGKESGLLVNFGTMKLEVNRLYNKHVG